MDFSVEYVMMCESAHDIQDMVKDREVSAKDFFAKNGESLIWIPRQDQLQDMILMKDDKGEIISDCQERVKYLVDHLTDLLPKNPAVITLDQFWLSIVMKTLYNKTWNLVTKSWEIV